MKEKLNIQNFVFSTKIFIRSPVTLFETEDAFQAKKHELVAKIQAAWRGLLQRRIYLLTKSKTLIVQKWVRGFLARRAAEKRRKAVQVLRQFIQGNI